MTDQPNNTAAIKALCKAQAEMTRATKGETNPHFRSKYADLGAVQDACFPALHKHGFAIMHHTGRDEDGRYLETTLMHESGGAFSCRVPLCVDKDNMQGIGSAFSYARRYGLMCVSSVAPEDDDGNSAAENPPKRGPSPAAATPFKATDEDIAREIAKIRTITGMDELGSYWSVLYKAQPSVAKHPDVIAAKDDMKAAISGGKEAA